MQLSSAFRLTEREVLSSWCDPCESLLVVVGAGGAVWEGV